MTLADDVGAARCGKPSCICSGGPHSVCPTAQRIESDRRAFLLSFSTPRKPKLASKPNHGRSWTGGSADPQQPMPPRVDTARHLRLTTDRYLKDRASYADVVEAFEMFAQACGQRPVEVERTAPTPVFVPMSTFVCADPANPACDCRACKEADAADAEHAAREKARGR